MKGEYAELRSTHIYNYNNISNNRERFKKSTGIEPDVFVYSLDFLDPGVDCINFKMYDTTKRLSEEVYTASSEHDDDEIKSSPKP